MARDRVIRNTRICLDVGLIENTGIIAGDSNLNSFDGRLTHVRSRMNRLTYLTHSKAQKAHRDSKYEILDSKFHIQYLN